MLQLTTILFLITGSVLAVLHIISLELFLYWRFWWLDIPMHALGGAAAALGAFASYDLRWFRNRRWLRRLPVLLFVLLVAIVWEVYEVLIGIPIESDYWSDTALDLVMGLLGGYIGWLVASRIRKLH